MVFSLITDGCIVKLPLSKNTTKNINYKKVLKILTFYIGICYNKIVNE